MLKYFIDKKKIRFEYLMNDLKIDIKLVFVKIDEVRFSIDLSKNIT